MASAEPYASLHHAPDRQPRQHPTTRFLQAGCPSCRPTNSVKALKAVYSLMHLIKNAFAQTANLDGCEMDSFLVLTRNTQNELAGLVFDLEYGIDENGNG